MTTKAPVVPLIREDMPSSGGTKTVSCDHMWKTVVVDSDDKLSQVPNGYMMLVCDKCSASKLVKKPQIKESKEDKPLLLG